MEAAFQSAFASSLLQNLIKLIGVIKDEYKKFQRGEEAVKSLDTTVVLAQDLLNSVNTFQLDDDTLRLRLQDRLDTMAILYLEAEDLIEDIPDFTRKSLSSRLKSMVSTWANDIKELERKLKKTIEEVKSIVELTGPAEANSGDHDTIDTELLVPLIGREKDIADVIERLITDDDSDHGVCILGMDGLGKTMLAEATLLDRRMLERFCCIRVASMEGCFDFKEATRQLRSIIGNNGVLQQQNQRLMIFFDNLLTLEVSAWTKFRALIKAQLAYKEIKFLITTFNPQVSRITRTTAHYLKCLSDENCKQVIVKKALLLNQNLPDSHLSHIAGILATKCEGLPVLARILGMVLAQDHMDDWAVNRLNKDLQDMSDVKREIISILRLSYHTMQPRLMVCLAFLSIFPHRHPFNMDDLIHLLVAEGILQQGEGKEYFSDLQGMSILQHSEHVNHTEKPKYELHKFSHIFSQFDASKTCLRLEQGVSSISDSSKIEDVRHLSLLCGDIQLAKWTQLEKFKRLRTFLSLNDRRIGPVPRQLFKALARLRVLKLKKTDITELPDSIHRLKRLRNLDISFTPINKLPETLCKLSNLQFLNLTNTSQLIHLPQQFQKLTNMLCLDWELSDIIRLHLPSHIGNLRRLQTLPLFMVGDSLEGYCISELKNMNCLKGSICIRFLEYVQNRAMAEEAMLCNKLLLEKIELQWMRLVDATVAEGVLAGLEPHVCLRELQIINYSGKLFPEWICDPSRSFQKIHLMKCPSCEILPALGELQTLKTLVIEEFASVTAVDRRFCGTSSVTRDVYFPSLESLTFKKLVQLRNWRGLEANDMPRLRILKIENCPEFINLPSLKNLTSLVELKIERCPAMRSLPELPSSLESLEIRESDLLKDRCAIEGEDWQKVDCIPYVEIDYSRIPTSGANNVPTPPTQPHQNIVYQGYLLVKDNIGAFSRLILRDKHAGEAE
ncbi:putative disease resistance RPP13-like protein 1 [Chenopodium quinoa]|uniref:putative disease resistance RPP13-like protein 1 n=1 Tax=Chenopodium quinoa TaxID=63459 RepID=UPI000B782438|nr:putative disease resistance RPP13-like protein 1 [Chenopodium quinoa]XP_021745609.1 putative disease resistance RPP13-like protein 1 [Chenopodium quinoa]